MEVYGIADPLALGARRFMVYTANLPATSRMVQSLHDLEEASDPLWYKGELDRALGRQVNRRRITSDQFIAGLG
jgi:hypothetical protein